MRTSRVLLALLAPVLLVLTFDGSATAAATKPVVLRPQAIQHFSRDVYVVSGTGNLIVVDPATVSPATPLFSAVGAPLGLTWGQFESSNATSWSTILPTRNGDVTEVLVWMDHLVPNAVYQTSYTTFGPESDNPLCAGVDRALALFANPLWPALPDRSGFKTDSKGRAAFLAEAPGRLNDATMLSFQVIYHADGQSYGALLNRAEADSQGDPSGCRSSYGVDAFRQIDIIVKGF